MIPPDLFGARVWRGTTTATVADPIVDGPVPRARAAWLVADRRTARLDVDGVGTFVVDGGRSVAVDLGADADPVVVDLWLYGLVATLVLGQQGRMALHATTVEVGGVGVAIAGHSRAGKSTTALELVRRGHRLIADDVSPVDVSPVDVSPVDVPPVDVSPVDVSPVDVSPVDVSPVDVSPVDVPPVDVSPVDVDRRGRNGAPPALTVSPYGRPLHVWPDAAEAAGMVLPPEHLVIPGSTKAILEAPPGAPVPLAAVVVIAVADPAGGARSLAVRSPAGADAAAVVSAQAYRSFVVQRLWGAEVVAWGAAVAAAVPVHVVERPGGRWSVGEVADTVEAAAADADAVARLG